MTELSSSTEESENQSDEIAIINAPLKNKKIKFYQVHYSAYRDNLFCIVELI